MAMPSSTPIVLNRNGTPPAAHAFLDEVAHGLEMDMPGNDVDVAVADCDERLVPVGLADSGGTEQTAVSGPCVASLDGVGTHAVNLDSDGYSVIFPHDVADPTNASKVGRSARGPPSPISRRSGRAGGRQERPWEVQRSTRSDQARTVAGWRITSLTAWRWRPGGKSVGVSILIAGRTAPMAGFHWRFHGVRLGRDDRRKFGRWRLCAKVRLDLTGIAGKWFSLGFLSGRSRGSDALAGRDDEVHEFGLNPDVFGTEGCKVIRYRRRDLFHE